MENFVDFARNIYICIVFALLYKHFVCILPYSILKIIFFVSLFPQQKKMNN